MRLQFLPEGYYKKDASCAIAPPAPPVPPLALPVQTSTHAHAPPIHTSIAPLTVPVHAHAHAHALPPAPALTVPVQASTHAPLPAPLPIPPLALDNPYIINEDTVSGPMVKFPNGYYIRPDGVRIYISNGRPSRLCRGRNDTCIYISKLGLCAQCEKSDSYPVFSDERFSVFPSGKRRCCKTEGNRRCLEITHGKDVMCAYHCGAYKCRRSGCNAMRAPKDHYCTAHAVQKMVRYTTIIHY